MTTARSRKQTVEPDADALAQIRAYAEQVSSAEDAIDKDSLLAAEKLRTLYDAKDWMTAWAKLKPAPKGRGSKGKDDSENQFNLYIERTTTLKVSYCKRLMKAGKWMQDYGAPVTGNLSGERALRPTYSMAGWGDEIVGVFERAASLAGDDVVTSAHVKDAVAEWRDKKPRDQRTMRAQNTRADQLERKAKQAIQDLLKTKSTKQIEDFKEWLARNLKLAEVEG